jgi:predicted dehydrogenase
MTLSAQTIRVGLIGYGFVAKVFHLPLIATVDGIEVVAVASSRPDIVRTEQPGLKVFAYPGDLIASDEIDVILVASPNDTHVRWASEALAAGKHVVVEKPFALSVVEARALISRAHAADRIVTVFQNRRWDSDFLSVRKAINSGRLGRVVHFESHFDRFEAEIGDRYWEKPGPGAGIWYDLAPHLVDQALQLFGVPDSIDVDLATLRDGSAVEDWAHAVLAYPRHRVILHASVLTSGGSARFSVHGDRGSLAKLKLDRQEHQLLNGIVPGSDQWGLDNDSLRLWDSDGSEHVVAAERGDQRGFYMALVQALRGQGPAPVQAHEAIAVAAVIDAGVQSAAEHRAVAIDLSDAERQAWHREP